MFSYGATAIDGFWAQGTTGHTDPASLVPDLASGTNDESNVFVNGAVATHNWSANRDVGAVNATITYDRLMNEYAIDEDLGGAFRVGPDLPDQALPHRRCWWLCPCQRPGSAVHPHLAHSGRWYAEPRL
jgi:hypothetical protein